MIYPGYKKGSADPKEFISSLSMRNMLDTLETATNGTWTSEYNEDDKEYEYTFVPTGSGTDSDQSLWYGIQWDDSANTPTPTRIGSTYLHRALPIQNNMKRCVVADNGTVYGYISDTDYTRYTTGELVDYTGGQGLVMVEVPEYYYETEVIYDSTTGVTTYRLKLYPFLQIGKKSRKVYVSAFEAMSDIASQPSNYKLYSVCKTNILVNNGLVKETELSYTDDAALFRGGNARSDSTNDNVAGKCQLGRPVTYLSLNALKTAAARRGTGWTQLYWGEYNSVIRLAIVEYCNFDIQATYNPNKDANGYAQGGIGIGLTNQNSWENYNDYNPIVPCGLTISLGSKSGVIQYEESAENEYHNPNPVNVNSYRGIENPFGHLYKWMDGIVLNLDNTDSVNTIKVSVCDNISVISSTALPTTESGFPPQNYLSWINTNFIISSKSTVYLDERGEIFPLNDGAFLSDYAYLNYKGVKAVHSGGAAHYGSYAGWFCFFAVHGASVAYRSFGGRLCYTPENI